MISPFLLFLLFDALFPLNPTRQYSQIVTDSEGNLLHAFLSPDQKWRMRTELSEISPDLRKAFLAKEDQYFDYHFGVNPFAIGRALIDNTLANRKTSGASTITMQVVRLLEPKERSYRNKMIEMFRALQLEWHFSKNEILQFYLNLVPYGGNIEGVKAASLLYFGKMPDQLSLSQITALTIVPNRPTSLALGKNQLLLEDEKNKWLLRFEKRQVFDKQTVADALEEPVNAYRREMPRLASHLARRMQSEHAQELNIQTTIQPAIQAKVEQITQNYSLRQHKFQIYHAAVLVVDNLTRKVIAYVGSPNFFDANGGQNDGTKSYRSPGSALKPLVYGLAFEAGLITPKSILFDVPYDFAGYRPENFDQKYHGKLTAETALANSLNIPAVDLLEKLGTKPMVEVLKKMDFRQIKRDEKKLGLSLALGGCGVNLWEMAGLYASFANGGIYKPLQILAKEESKMSFQILSEEANYLVTNTLTQVQRPHEIPSDYLSNPKLPKIAWKTGTSYGRRDAWSIGFNKRFTVAVWIGNFDGTGVPELVGAGMATPLLFQIFNILDYNSPLDWFKKPQNLLTRKICTETGLPPAQFCQDTIADFFVAGVSPSKVCEHLKPVFVSLDQKMSFCSHCFSGTYTRKYFQNLAPELIDFYERQKITYEKIPPHNPTCTLLAGGKAPLITSPSDQREYLTAGDEDLEMWLACQASNDVEKVYWFIDNRFYKTALATEKVFFKPKRGKIRISCTDDKGRNTNIAVLVK